ncbi:hypothetical protein PCE1_004499 [Barthelona sp. PCE]
MAENIQQLSVDESRLTEWLKLRHFIPTDYQQQLSSVSTELEELFSDLQRDERFSNVITGKVESITYPQLLKCKSILQEDGDKGVFGFKSDLGKRVSQLITFLENHKLHLALMSTFIFDCSKFFFISCKKQLQELSTSIDDIKSRVDNVTVSIDREKKSFSDYCKKHSLDAEDLRTSLRLLKHSLPRFLKSFAISLFRPEVQNAIDFFYRFNKELEIEISSELDITTLTHMLSLDNPASFDAEQSVSVLEEKYLENEVEDDKIDWGDIDLGAFDPTQSAFAVEAFDQPPLPQETSEELSLNMDDLDDLDAMLNLDDLPEFEAPELEVESIGVFGHVCIDYLWSNYHKILADLEILQVFLQSRRKHPNRPNILSLAYRKQLILEDPLDEIIGESLDLNEDEVFSQVRQLYKPKTFEMVLEEVQRKKSAAQKLEDEVRVLEGTIADKLEQMRDTHTEEEAYTSAFIECVAMVEDVVLSGGKCQLTIETQVRK